MAEKRASKKGGVSAIDGDLWEIKQALDQLGFDVTQGKYPPSLLKDIKFAVDELRLNLWGILEMQEDDNHKEARSPFIPTRQKLAEFRMKRVERMLTDLRMDLTEGAIPGSDAGLKTLTASLQATLHNISRATQRKV